MKILSSLVLILGLAGCAHTIKTPDAPAPVEHKENTSLTREMAMTRAKQVHRVSYSLWFAIDDHHEDFRGRTVINFELREKSQDFSSELLIDFTDGTIRALGINGTQLSADDIKLRYDGHRIHLRVGELIHGANRIEISYAHVYEKDGMGLHRFKDPVDSLSYMFSDNEPYHAHLIFPCFDQPDLKASYELTVEAPKEWEVIGNTLEREVTTVDGRNSWQFPPSPVFSTYLFALIAGPFKSWKSDANGIPLRLFARQSLAKYVDAPEWFEVTKRGLEFYNIQFAYLYPYAKYDQILVPEFNHGAMENVGAVTFTERMIFRSKVTADRRRGRADVILHEMAHMWFGDLVTMRWWNGLWLNESFATFMASTALSTISYEPGAQFKNVWQAFFSGEKEWAYWEDQLVTTHPIEVHVPDTDHAFANFDGITYGKGAAVLKQLGFYLGEEDFKEGLQRYFQKFANRNTTLTDFIHSLSEASGQNLTDWEKTWLQTTGVNTITANWECNPEDGTLTKLSLTQTPSQPGNQLRSHKTIIGLYHWPKKGAHSELKSTEAIEFEYSKAETNVDEAIGKACPAMVFPNDQDQDYVRVTLDPKTLETVRAHLSAVGDSLTRQMIWHTLWDMVITTKLSAQDYAQIAMSQLATEKDSQIVQKVLEKFVSSDPHALTILKILSGDDHAKYSEKFQAWLNTHLRDAAPGSDLQLIWFQAYLSATKNETTLAFLESLLTGKQKIRGLAIEQDRRWEIIRTLARNGHPDSQGLIEKELLADATEMGQKEAAGAQASFPTPDNKTHWFKVVTRQSETASENKLNLSSLQPIMRKFHISDQEGLSRAWVDPYFAALSTLAKSEDDEIMSAFTRFMFPALCDQVVSQKTATFLASAAAANLPAGSLKSLKISNQEEDRCIQARAYSLTSKTTGQ